MSRLSYDMTATRAKIATRKVARTAVLAGLAKWLRAAVTALAFLLPLVVVPGSERPFSTPKFFLLGGMVALGAVVAALSGQLSWPALPRWFLISLVAWLATMGISAAFGEFVSPTALWLPLFAAGWFWLLISIQPKVKPLALALVLSGFIVAVVALVQYLGLDPFTFMGWTAPPGGSERMRVFATLGNPNFVAAFLVAIMPLTLAVGSTFARERRRPRALLFAALLLEVLAVLATGAKAAIVALAVVLLWIVVLRRVAKWRYLAGAAVLIAVLLLAYGPSRPLKTTLLGRYYIWRVTAPHLVERPLFGFGPGAFAAKYIEWETQYWREGRGSDVERRYAALQDHAHNDYLETLVDNGAAGLVSFAALVLLFLVFSFRWARSEGSELLTGASAGVFALLAVALVDFPLRRPTELFVFWTLVALAFLEVNPQAPMSGQRAIHKGVKSVREFES